MSLTAKAWAGLIAGLSAALLLAAAGFAIHCTGRMQERAAWQQKEAQRAAQIASELRAEYERGRAASAQYQLGAGALQARYLSLEGPANELRHRTSLVIPSVEPNCRISQPVCPASALGLEIPADVQAPGEEQPAAGRSAPRLSRAAVWLWNSALAGSDVPTGACGLADTSIEACAVDAGVTIDDAWINHDINAKSCAADRLRHRALIEFLTERSVP